ncbi:hypothetical protein NSB25_17960 [Acetatifactor muris]|uniref:Uncharacterized protein n=1 Tax=Acetatifactor muris TaxID=879566 RepID=A0A2K4ZKC1_9FIRM|nr:hypothetical protein [Acetatifactor muris]MCR2049154.1 hypothetical protein [Acetatifactor muris]MCX4306507.1 hypothetical protein [Acetatifactor sp.]SOY30927.1 hypothetical protein AMURIS_03661 [Acetatifactor muris]
MTELPISDFMQDYYKKEGITFTDSERATILWNSPVPLPKAEILEALREIADTTADEALRAQIHERLDTERERLQLFEESDGRCFFICAPDDSGRETGWHCRYFTTLEAAVAYGRDEAQGTFKVEKEFFWDMIDGCSPDDGADMMGGLAWYTEDGMLLGCECYPYMSEEIAVRFSHGDPSRFEDVYIPLQSPFEAGDIVRMVGDTRPAVVQVSQEEWRQSLERDTNGPRTIPPAYDNTRLTVEFLYDDGEMHHGHPALLSLERIDQWEDGHEWELLQSASRLIREEKGIG